MTPLPKKRHAKARSKVRRAAHKLTLPKLITCASCGNLRLPHLACPSCGAYKQTKSEEKK